MAVSACPEGLLKMQRLGAQPTPMGSELLTVNDEGPREWRTSFPGARASEALPPHPQQSCWAPRGFARSFWVSASCSFKE